ncbi:aminotransferase class I/II-fold pyridoxal phosphate-dependent enzyme [Paenibacillus sp. FJAT-27812]|uniref:aminotransferase class I/II-fold pyridoxal phosphate-dependent enzyme n=1 Tax=Paenibacillus sp. FJAT-27812 TaxID=1684143 RepID=UPI0006A7A585|nr:aminotransferase class I/II-fold pyridoxal phosphate-dependent enzyme [Paenibacillus sp. FJAT-27812]
MKKLFRAPIFEALINHATSDPVGFHVPGHHGGQALKQDLWDEQMNGNALAYFEKIMQLDVTELSSTDDLHHPEASIMEAQKLAAVTFGAEETYFLVGGSTSGNIALLLTVCEPDDIIIVQRNVHKSIINGLKLAGARAVFLTPQIEPQTGLTTVPTVRQVEEALAAYPEAKAVFLSNPNYYGMGVKLKPYIDVVHSYNKPIMIDEAHGAHYGHHASFPKSAVYEGADAVVQSAHKTLPTLTMGALLHVQGSRIPRDTLQQSLAMIQSSSPSFPILASIDISRAMIDTLGDRLFDQSMRSAAAFREWLEQQQATPISEMKIEDERSDTLRLDPLRVVMYDRSGTYSGYELQKHLERYGCFAEMADPRYVVLVFGIQTSLRDTQRLQEAIAAINDGNMKQGSDIKSMPYINEGLQLSNTEPVSFARARFKNKASLRIQLSAAEHHISAEMVTPYPPGIAILYPGERITATMIAHIQHLSAMGAKFQGAADPDMETIRVYQE